MNSVCAGTTDCGSRLVVPHTTELGAVAPEQSGAAAQENSGAAADRSCAEGLAAIEFVVEEQPPSALAAEYNSAWMELWG